MAHLGGQIYTSIKEAITFSSGDFGVISTFQDADLKLWYFVNGKPIISIKAPKK